jgi:hypothetical protein
MNIAFRKVNENSYLCHPLSRLAPAVPGQSRLYPIKNLLYA